MANPYEPPQAPGVTARIPRESIDLGVVFVIAVIFASCAASLLGLVSQSVNSYLMPRMGWVGGFVGINALIFFGMWLAQRTRRLLFAAGFMTCIIGIINACVLYSVGTVDVVENVFHDRVHSSWIWAVASYLSGGCYVLIAAFRRQRETNLR